MNKPATAMHFSHAMVCTVLKGRIRAEGIQEVHNKDLILHKEVKEVKEATFGWFSSVSS